MPKITKPSNSITLTGALVEHSLTEVESQNGRVFIRGKLVVDTSTDESVSNEVAINVLQFADKKDRKTDEYVPDSRYDTLHRLMTEEDSIGKVIRVSGNFNNSVFVRDGETVKASQMAAGFISTTNPGKLKSEFKVTGIVKNIIPEVVQDEETGNVIVSLEVFNYNGTNLIPKTFVVDKDNTLAKRYFLESGELEIGDVTDLWGRIETQTSTKFVESAWGEKQEVEGASRTVAIITGARKTPYELDEDLENQIREARQVYNTYVATQEERAREYEAQQQTSTGQATQKAQSTTPNKGSFDF